jgi:hypothetical protein
MEVAPLNRFSVPAELHGMYRGVCTKLWMGRTESEMSERYDKIREDIFTPQEVG